VDTGPPNAKGGETVVTALGKGLARRKKLEKTAEGENNPQKTSSQSKKTMPKTEPSPMCPVSRTKT